MTDHRYWVLCHEALSEFLHRAHSGEDPDLLLMEMYANSESEYVEGEDG